MKTLSLVQGSSEWLAVRAKHLCASDAPAMMGASKHTKRDDLVRLAATGGEREFSEWEQRFLLDKGHAAEAAIRPVIEGLLGEDLFPVTASDDEGRLLASYDGVTMDNVTGFEHKIFNEELAGAHGAIHDARAASRIYFHLKREGKL